MAVLFIDTWSSECGSCGKGADPKEKQHDTVLSYGGTEEGCHEPFTEVGSHYRGIGERKFCAEMRPDLPWTERLT